MHGADLTEWNLTRQDEWPTSLYDENFTEENPVGEYGPVPLSDGSDGSDCEDGDDEAVAAQEEEALGRLAQLLQDPQWHPSALPVDLKRLLLTSTSTRARRMMRWYYARLVGKTYMHDRHSGGPVTIQPVFGNDSDSDSAPSSRDDSGEEETPAPECQELRVLTWNTNANLECPFL